MPNERRRFAGAEKLAILRKHLIEKLPLSEVCQKHGISPTLFYQWQKKLFEERGQASLNPRPRMAASRKPRLRRPPPSKPGWRARMRSWPS